ncbi:MAG: tail fiber domain-containing protein [Flavobacteriaceae bacterium]
MRKIVFLISLFTFAANAQVGIGTTTPNAALDITVNDATNPGNTDGLLIPRIDVFPTVNPTASQQGMLVYLTTTAGTNTPGFYYWDNTITSWVAIAGKLILEDADQDTKVQVEETADEDIIRFDLGGTEHFKMEKGRLEVLGTGNSVFMGRNAGDNDDYTGNRNVFIGDNTGRYSTTGWYNVAIGSSAMTTNTTGANNLALGADALRLNSTGWGNVALGANALENATGQTNIAIGYNSLTNITSGTENVTIGYRSGSNNITGDQNVFIGQETGLSNTGSGNVFLGYRAGWSETGSNKLYLDNSTTSNPLIWGDFATNEIVINGSLGVEGNYVFPTTDGTSGQVLSTDGAGSVSWSTILDNELIDTDGDTKVEVESSPDEDMIRFELGGTENFRMDNGKLEVLGNGNSVFIGQNAGDNDDQTTNKNVYVGNNTGRYSTTGESNVAIGSSAMSTNTTGNYNLAIGADALLLNSTGWGNIALGFRALQKSTGEKNVAIGMNSLFSLTTGIQNTALGYRAGTQNSTGSQNVFIGQESGLTNSGSGNVFLGYSSGANETGDNLLYIDNSSSSTPLIWGDFSTNEIVINGSLGVDGNYVFPTTDGTSGQVLSTDGAGNVSWSTILGNELIDADGDTKIQVEESADEDIIRFDLGGTEHFKMDGPRLEVLNSGNSVFIGENAGLNDDLSANTNVAVGRNTLRNNSTGAFNTAIGDNAMFNSTNVGNTAVGASSLYSNTSYNNTAIGVNALRFNTTGYENVTLGYGSLRNNVTGNRNTALGFEAGLNSSGSNNILIGYRAGNNETGSNLLYIDNSNTTTPLIWGDFSANEIVINGSLGVGGNYVFPTVDGTSGQVLSTDGAGNVSWGTISLTDTDDQFADVFQLNGNNLELSLDGDGVATQTVDLSAFLDNTDTDDQFADVFQLNGNNLELSLEGDGIATQTVDLSAFLVDTDTDDQFTDVFQLNGNNLELSLDGDGVATQTVDLSAFLDDTDTDDQFADVFQLNGNNLELSLEGDGIATQTVDLSAFLVDTDTDDQFADVFQLNGNNLELSLDGDGVATQTVDLSAFLDDTDTDDQFADVFQLNGNNLELSLDGDGIATQTVDLSAFLDDTDTDDQFADIFQLNGNNLELSLDGDGIATQTVDLSAFLDDTDTDDQFADVFQLNGNNLELSLDGDGIATQTVDLSSLSGSDNLGNHTATQNISTNGNYISNDGDNEGVYIDTDGNVGIATNTPGYPLEINGNARVNHRLFFGTDGSMLNGTNQGGSIELGPSNSAGGEIPFIDFHYGSGVSEDYNFRIINNANKELSFTSSTGDKLVLNNSGVEIGGNYTIPLNDGTNGQVLSTDGSGNVSWSTVSGGGSSDEIVDADGDTKVQVEESVDEDKIRFDLAGTERFVMDGRRLEVLNNNDNVLIGDGAGASVTGTGLANVFMGTDAGAATTVGDYNTAIGYQTMVLNIGGPNQGSNNSAFGTGSLFGNTYGSENTAIGRNAMFANSTGDCNTAVGVHSLTWNSTGDYNTALGYFAFYDLNYTNISNSMALGYNSDVTASNTVSIGNSTITSIGGYANWTNLSDGRFKKNVKENVVGLDFIMKLRPVSYNLDVTALERFKKTPDSIRLKDAELLKAKEVQTGFIAQEVEKAAQEVGFDFHGVDKPDNDNSHYGLRYAEFVVPMVKAMQEQQKAIEELQKEKKSALNAMEIRHQKEISAIRSQLLEQQEMFIKLQAQVNQYMLKNN